MLFHTSPVEIKEVRNDGLLGSFVCFADRPYYMSKSEDTVVYQLPLEAVESGLIRASALFYHENASVLEPLVTEVAKRLKVDSETAESLIEESSSVWDVLDEPDLDLDYYVQACTCRAAQILGFTGVIARDEEGSVLMLDLHKVLSKMTLVKE